MLVVFQLSARPLRPKCAAVRAIFAVFSRAAGPPEKVESTMLAWGEEWSKQIGSVFVRSLVSHTGLRKGIIGTIMLSR